MTDAPYIVRFDGSKSYGRVVSAAEWPLALAPRDLSFIRIDHQTRLQLEDVEVMIENEFLLRIENVVHRLDPGERAGLAPLLSVYPDRLSTASVDADGTLHLGFGRGATITVPPDPHYEPWQINGPGDAMVVCGPGTSGHLSVWT